MLIKIILPSANFTVSPRFSFITLRLAYLLILSNVFKSCINSLITIAGMPEWPNGIAFGNNGY